MIWDIAFTVFASYEKVNVDLFFLSPHPNQNQNLFLYMHCIILLCPGEHKKSLVFEMSYRLTLKLS